MRNDITQILKKIETGDQHAASELLSLVYEELRKLATHRMSQENAGQTLQPTALVHWSPSLVTSLKTIRQLRS